MNINVHHISVRNIKAYQQSSIFYPVTIGNNNSMTHLLLGDVELPQLLHGNIYPVALPNVLSDVPEDVRELIRSPKR